MKNLLNKLIIIGFLSIFFNVFACKNADEVPYTLAKNYFVRSDYPDGNLHMLKIESQEKFNSIFGMAPLMGDDGMPTDIDFSKSFVIALIDNTNNRTESLSVKSLTKENGKLKLLYDIKERQESSSAFFRFSTIIIVDKKYMAEVSARRFNDSGYPMVGDDLDETGCKPSTGYTWSVLENNCIQPWETKYVIKGSVSAALLFSKDNKKAELIGSKYTRNLVFTKKPKGNIWAAGNLTLTQTQKDNFVLKENNKEIAKGTLRK